MSNELVLKGLDGSNPLAFLAALGTLRALSKAWPDRNVKMAWKQHQSAWRPVLYGVTDENTVSAELLAQCQITKRHATLGVSDDLNINVVEYRKHLQEQIKESDREATSFAASFGSDVVCNDKGIIVDTSLRTMSGAGHQHFLKTMRDVLAIVTDEQIHKTLFMLWQYEDPLKGLSLRFDPMDEKRYALRWDDPSGDPARNTSGNMLGANALAVLGIPLLLVAPVRGELHTTGFRGQRSSDCYWTWPIWDAQLSLDVVASLLTFSDLQCDKLFHDRLSSCGIAEVYRSQRITSGKFRNFTPAQPV
jgi:hypothetical protein